MKPFKKHTGTIALVNRGNIDTDQIISKEFLKSIKRTGFGEHLFHDWRYLENGNLNQKFSLNDPKYKNASILVVGNNFGCGSSREHAVWAILQYGFAVVIAPRKGEGEKAIPGFADIFRNNSFKNGLLPIEMSETEVGQIITCVESGQGIRGTIDLEHQTLVIHGPKELQFSFEIDPGLKQKLLFGVDDIGQTEECEKLIENFEKSHSTQLFI